VTNDQFEQSNWVEIVPGIHGLRRFTAVNLSDDYQVDYELGIEYVDDRRRYVCRTLQVKPEITNVTLRSVPIERYMRVMLEAGLETGTIEELPNPDGREPWGLHPPEGVTDGGPTRRCLAWVAHLYKYAEAIRVDPTQFVANRLDTPISTVGRWVARARKAGNL
jgi:hypothetical protein